MRPTDQGGGVAAVYRDFAEREATESPTYARWADGLAGDPEVAALVAELPVGKRQPNLVFTAARWHGASTPSDYEALRSVLQASWPAVRQTVLDRSTQTNEVGRCATLLPLLAGLDGPLALVEVGASAGLCLHPDRWSYRYYGIKSGAESGTDDGTDGGTGSGTERALVAQLDPADGPSPVVLDCRVEGGVPLPTQLPRVVYRGGVDLNPLDLASGDTAAWLQTLVWPEHEDRRARLTAACEVAAGEQVDLLRGDLLTGLTEAVQRACTAAPEATVVIFHSAVLAYVDAAGREQWPDVVMAVVEQLRADGRAAHWISNEGIDVLPGVSSTARCHGASTDFCLALDGRAVGWTHGHGRHLVWC